MLLARSRKLHARSRDVYGAPRIQLRTNVSKAPSLKLKPGMTLTRDDGTAKDSLQHRPKK
jgi:hypothetical protein